MVQYSTLLRAIREPLDRTIMLRLTHNFHDATVVEDTLAQSFAILAGDLDPNLGWVRAIRTMLDISQPLPLDTLAWDEYPVTAVRLSAVVAVPPVETIERIDHIHETIDRAIAVGAPIYNNGDARHCATIYWATTLTLVQAPVTRGFPGQARVLKQLRSAIEEPLPVIGHDLASIDNFAWHMRHILDAARNATG